MTQIKIPTQTLSRISSVVSQTTDTDLQHVLLQCKDSQLYLIATDEQIAVAETIGQCESADFNVFIRIDDSFIDSLYSSILIDGITTIDIIPDICFADLTTDTGYKADKCFKWFDENKLLNWKKWFVSADSQQGFMYWNLYQINKLFKSSLSGNIVFPKLIDSSKPCIVRDIDNSDWIGVFIPSCSEKSALKPAEIPQWLI